MLQRSLASLADRPLKDNGSEPWIDFVVPWLGPFAPHGAQEQLLGARAAHLARRQVHPEGVPPGLVQPAANQVEPVVVRRGACGIRDQHAHLLFKSP